MRTNQYVYPSHCTASWMFETVPRDTSAFKASSILVVNLQEAVRASSTETSQEITAIQ
jgi:hypothetical protein